MAFAANEGKAARDYGLINYTRKPGNVKDFFKNFSEDDSFFRKKVLTGRRVWSILYFAQKVDIDRSPWARSSCAAGVPALWRFKS